LGELIAYERQRRGLTRVELAALVRRADHALGTDESQIKRWEKGQQPQPAALRVLAVVLERPVEELTALTMQAPSAVLDALELPPAQPADQNYVDSIRATIQRLLGLSSQHGGDEVAPLAARSLHAVRRRLAFGGYSLALTTELQAAAGELAEVAGWLMHDADHQEEARRLNVEALYLLRLAGDRNIELLTLSNMSFIALFQQQPGEALMLARAALDGGHLTNRQQVMFELRRARALAQLGAKSEAIQAAQAAQAFLARLHQVELGSSPQPNTNDVSRVGSGRHGQQVRRNGGRDLPARLDGRRSGTPGSTDRRGTGARSVGTRIPCRPGWVAREEEAAWPAWRGDAGMP